MVEVDTSVIPQVRYDVRRRRYGTVTWLIRKNDWFQIDGTTDAIWLACEDGISVAEIATRLADDSKMALGEALAATILTISRLQVHRLLENAICLPAGASS